MLGASLLRTAARSSLRGSFVTNNSALSLRFKSQLFHRFISSHTKFHIQNLSPCYKRARLSQGIAHTHPPARRLSSWESIPGGRNASIQANVPKRSRRDLEASADLGTASERSSSPSASSASSSRWSSDGSKEDGDLGDLRAGVPGRVRVVASELSSMLSDSFGSASDGEENEDDVDAFSDADVLDDEDDVEVTSEEDEDDDVDDEEEEEEVGQQHGGIRRRRRKPPLVFPASAIVLSKEEQGVLRALMQTNATYDLGCTIRIAGGWVRDKLLGRASHDMDVVLDNCSGEKFAKMFRAVVLANPSQYVDLDEYVLQFTHEFKPEVTLTSADMPNPSQNLRAVLSQVPDIVPSPDAPPYLIDAIADKMDARARGGVPQWAALCVNDQRWLDAKLRKSASRVSVVQANPDKSKHLATAVVSFNGISLDFCQLRSETYADSSRVPTTVEAGTPRDDALRRDFTMNSLFYNVATHSVEDYTRRGVYDLEDRVIRTPRNAVTTFLEDPLRVLRGLRFSSVFQYRLHSSFFDAISNEQMRAVLWEKISRERVGEELWKLLSAKSPRASLSTLYDFGYYDVVFPLYRSENVSVLTEAPRPPFSQCPAPAVSWTRERWHDAEQAMQCLMHISFVEGRAGSHMQLMRKLRERYFADELRDAKRRMQRQQARPITLPSREWAVKTMYRKRPKRPLWVAEERAHGPKLGILPPEGGSLAHKAELQALMLLASMCVSLAPRFPRRPSFADTRRDTPTTLVLNMIKYGLKQSSSRALWVTHALSAMSFLDVILPELASVQQPPRAGDSNAASLDEQLLKQYSELFMQDREHIMLLRLRATHSDDQILAGLLLLGIRKAVQHNKKSAVHSMQAVHAELCTIAAAMTRSKLFADDDGPDSEPPKPVNGRVLATALGLQGRDIGFAVSGAQSYKMRHPGASEEDVIAWLKEHLDLVRQAGSDAAACFDATSEFEMMQEPM